MSSQKERNLTIDPEMRELHNYELQRLGQFYDAQDTTPELRLHYDADSAQLMPNLGG